MIKGITDSGGFRRDGFIRAGYPKKGKAPGENSEHFQLRDAPQLIPVLGENPSEIYFTVYDDHLEAIAPHDLRKYAANDPVCIGDGQQAAFFANASDVSGLTQQPHPFMAKSRLRHCLYKNCPDYQAGDCHETIRIEMVIPQFSMASLFTLWNRSINLILDAISCFKKTQIQTAGKLSGQIFRIYKVKKKMPFQNVNTGRRGRSEKDVISMEYVPFGVYEEKFRNKITDENWAALIALRERHCTSTDYSRLALEAPQAQAQLPGPMEQALVESPTDQEDAVKKRANHEVVLPLFEQLGALVNKEPTEALRIATAKNFSDVGKLADYLKKKIASEKKNRAAKEDVVAETAPTIPPATVQSPVPSQTGQGLL